MGVRFPGCDFLVVAAMAAYRRRRARSGSPLDLNANVPVLSSPAMLEPGVFGIFRPVLLLPEGITDRLAPAHLDAILAHELCHVRRRDNLAAALHMAVEAIFWFHPLVWWVGARLVEERERACDEEVLRLGSQPEVYAESILKTCQFYLESPLVCMSGIAGSDLKKRITRIMTGRGASISASAESCCWPPPAWRRWPGPSGSV
jgi:bla regulator protein blaR1